MQTSVKTVSYYGLNSVTDLSKEKHNFAERNCQYCKFDFLKIIFWPGGYSCATSALCFGRKLFLQLHQSFRYLHHKISAQFFLKIFHLSFKEWQR